MEPKTGSAVPLSEVQEELARILASSAFSRPRRLARLLKYLVEHTLQGETEQLKETVLGVEVFDRGTDFDPRTDPIVRIDARRLRARLAQYYSDEGASDPVIITLETGSYVPLFRRRNNDAEATDAAPNQPLRTRFSVAVLPFVNLSDQPEYGLFCEGLSEDILNRLAQQGDMRVIARTSAFQFQDPTRDPRSIAKQLRVNTLVTGSLRGGRNDVRIAVQLVNAADSSIFWSQEYQQPGGGLIDIQETIAREVASRFQTSPQPVPAAAHLSPTPSRGPAHSRGRNNKDAYRLFLQGRRLLHQGKRESYLQGIDLLEEAVKADPAYAAAWGNLSVGCASALMFRLRNQNALITRARFAAERALQLDATSPDAHAALGFVAGFADFNFVEARRCFDNALLANPMYGFARVGRALLWCAPTGQLDEAEDELERVLSTDPLNAEALINLGRVFYFERRFDKAAETLQLVLDNNSQHGSAWLMLAWTREQMGMKPEAIDAYRQWQRLLSYSFTGVWTKAVEHILLGDLRFAERAAKKMAWIARFTPAPLSGLVADLFIRLGDHERGLEWLERAYKERAIRLVCVAVDPGFDRLRNQPRFTRLVTTILGSAAPATAEQAAAGIA
jgi:adenylate cyclase